MAKEKESVKEERKEDITEFLHGALKPVSKRTKPYHRYQKNKPLKILIVTITKKFLPVNSFSEMRHTQLPRIVCTLQMLEIL